MNSAPEAPESTSEPETERRPTTFSGTVQFSMRGFADEQSAQALAHAVAAVMRIIGEEVDLSGLDGVTIGHDYDEALSSVDRGKPGLRPLSRTNGDAIVGVAMAPAVLREEVAKTHVVVWAPLVEPLLGDDAEAVSQAISLIAHECGHVADHGHRERVLPGIVLRHRFTGPEEALLFPAAEAVWEEYAACRYAAPFTSEDTEASYRQGLAGVLRRAREAANDAIRSYRAHGDVDRVLLEAGNPIAEPLRLAAYLAGHLDGRGRDALEEMRGDLEADPRLAPRIVEAIQAVRAMWDERERWPGLSIFDPLKDVFRTVYADHGMIFGRLPDGTMFVDIPFTAETMPR